MANIPLLGAEPPRSAANRPAAAAAPATVQRAWWLIGWLGLAFVLMGVVDIVLGILPFGLGNPEWEFGVITSILNSFAIPTMGGYLLMASLLARGKARAARALGIAAVCVAGILGILALLYLTVIPVALRATSKNATIQFGMKKAIIKGVIFLVAYATLYLFAAIVGWRAARVEASGKRAR